MNMQIGGRGHPYSPTMQYRETGQFSQNFPPMRPPMQMQNPMQMQQQPVAEPENPWTHPATLIAGAAAFMAWQNSQEIQRRSSTMTGLGGIALGAALLGSLAAGYSVMTNAGTGYVDRRVRNVAGQVNHTLDKILTMNFGTDANNRPNVDLGTLDTALANRGFTDNAGNRQASQTGMFTRTAIAGAEGGAEAVVRASLAGAALTAHNPNVRAATDPLNSTNAAHNASTLARTKLG